MTDIISSAHYRPHLRLSGIGTTERVLARRTIRLVIVDTRTYGSYMSSVIATTSPLGSRNKSTVDHMRQLSCGPS